MLSAIKDLVNQKREFLESAELLYEEMTGVPDDMFLESGQADDNDEPIMETPTEGPEGVPATEDGPDDDDDDDDEDDGDILMTKVGEIDHGPAAYKLPPVSDGDDTADLLNVSVDLSSNTVSDTLPVPPANASEAIDDDMLATRVGDGFGESEEPPAEEPPVETTPTEPPADLSATPSFQEAISLGADGEKGEGEETPPEETGDKKKAEGEGETVTDAVMDKVAEAEAEPAPITGTIDQQAIQDKLDKLSKNIMDVKETIKKELGRS